MRIHIVFAMLCMSVVTSFAQQAQWELKAGTEVYNPILSSDGKHLVYFTNDDKVVVSCVNVSSGSKVWSHELKKFEQYRLGRFLGNDTVMIGQDNRYEFLNVRDGSVIKTLPIVGESWDDLKWEAKADAEADTLKPYFKNHIGVFYFDDGMQILDLVKLEIIYQTDQSPSKIKHQIWEATLMINPLSGADSIYFVETMTGKLVYKGSKDDNDINTSVYQPFAVSNGELLLFNDDNIQDIDLASAKVSATIAVDPDDPEFYSPILFKKGVYLLVSDEGIQKLYSTKDGKLLWQTAAGAVPGVVEQLVELQNDEALLMAYESSGKMVIYKINSTTGAKLWSRELFIQDGSFETGHKQGSKVWATIGKIAYTMVMASMRSQRSFGYNPMSGRTGYYYDPFSFSNRRQRAAVAQEANDMYNSWINTKKKTEGYTNLLFTTDNQVVLATAGKIYSIKDGQPSKDYDAEGILTLNLSDGAVANWKKCELLAKSESGDFNAFKDLNIQKVELCRFLTGTHDVHIVRGDSVQTFNFGEEVLSFINTGANAVTVMANHDDEYYDYWRIDASSVPAQKYLLARSTNRCLVFHDSDAVSTMLNITDVSVDAFGVMPGDVTSSTFSSPKWKLTEADLDKLELGDFNEKRDFYDRLQGVRIAGGDVYVMGDNRIGFISSDASCRWTNEWSPEAKATGLGLTTIGNKVLYSTGGRTVVLKNACPVQVVSDNEISFSQTVVLIPEKDKNYTVVIDTDEGVIRGFSMN